MALLLFTSIFVSPAGNRVFGFLFEDPERQAQTQTLKSLEEKTRSIDSTSQSIESILEQSRTNYAQHHRFNETLPGVSIVLAARLFFVGADQNQFIIDSTPISMYLTPNGALGCQIMDVQGNAYAVETHNQNSYYGVITILQCDAGLLADEAFIELSVNGIPLNETHIPRRTILPPFEHTSVGARLDGQNGTRMHLWRYIVFSRVPSNAERAQLMSDWLNDGQTAIVINFEKDDYLITDSENNLSQPMSDHQPSMTIE